MMSLIAYQETDPETQIENLRLFYTSIDTNAQEVFDERVIRWRNDPKSYIGFLGEINFAERLRQWSVRHRFLAEGNTQSPDIELIVNNKPVYLEVKMIRENPNIDFLLSVNDEIQTFGSGCAFLSLKIPREKKLVTQNLLMLQV
jgi:hypothetical protein